MRKTTGGKTPLYCAAERGHHEVVALFLETGQLDVNAGGNQKLESNAHCSSKG